MKNPILRHALLVPVYVTICGPVHAADESTAAGLEWLQDEALALPTQIRDLERTSTAHAVTSRRAPDAQGSLARISLANGRPTFLSADGRFTVSLRGLIQYDLGYYAQDKAPPGTDLSSGGNFRRAQIGLQGTAFSDWSYDFIYDFGGSGTEKPGYIYSAYAQYDGLKPFGFRIGAYAPPEGIDDATSSADLIFTERPAAADVARNIAGAPSRDSVTVFYAGGRLYGALSYTGDKVSDSGVFDEQQAIVGRLSYLIHDTADSRILLGGGVTDVFKLPGTAAGAASAPVAGFSITPEVTVDSNSTKFVNTGNIPAAGITEWSLEGAGYYRNLYAQGGYFRYGIARSASPLPDPRFSGWYILGTYVLTGESRRYNPATATFQNPRPAGRWGAWEIAARYSNIDLNDDSGLAGAATPGGGIRGGNQNVFSAGLNWYPNTVFHFALDYDDIAVQRLNAAGADIGLSAQAVVFRTQVSF